MENLSQTPLPPQGSGIYGKTKNNQWWKTPEEQHLLHTTGLKYIWDQRACDSMYKACTNSSQTISQHDEGKWVQSPTPNQEDTCWEKETLPVSAQLQLRPHAQE